VARLATVTSGVTVGMCLWYASQKIQGVRTSFGGLLSAITRREIHG
jgi:hypothetical protein